MIPAEFDYCSPTSPDEAVRILGEHGEEAKILAGGHSLLPLMKLRLAVPSLLVDLGRISDLSYIQAEDTVLRIGAMTRYVDLIRSDTVVRGAPVLAQAAELVGDAQVRNRGTLGGAIAHADPAGDMPAVIQALDATVQVLSPRGMRSVHVDEFFADIMQSVLEPDEIITEIRIPIDSDQPRQHYEKFRRRACDWAIVGSAVRMRTRNGSIESARVALTNVATTPVRASSTEQGLAGRPATRETIRAAAEAASQDLDPTPELNAPSDYKRHLACVVTERALTRALSL